jgi:hypothetical protein
MKYIRDTVALFFGAEDNDRRFIWEYGQEMIGRVGVRVKIEEDCPPSPRPRPDGSRD